jgi:hypothetical protein
MNIAERTRALRARMCRAARRVPLTPFRAPA